MPLMPQMFANQAQAELIPSTTSTTDTGMAFGFQASRVHVQNDRAAAVYVTFGSTVGSTGGFRTCSGESLVVSGMQCSGMGVLSTTTSTGTAVRVLALG